jgi:hypothetical protein
MPDARSPIADYKASSLHHIRRTCRTENEKALESISQGFFI